MSPIKNEQRLIRRWVKWLGGREPAVLISLLIIVIATWVFIELADRVVDGQTGRFDNWMVRAMRTPEDPSKLVGPEWLQELGRDATALGGYGWLIFFTVATAGFLALDRKTHMAIFLIASATSGYMVSSLLKMMFQRPRPEIVPHLSYVYQSTSFPSGHSMNSAVIFLTLGVLIAASVSQRRLKVYVIIVAMLISGCVGVSRVYLGVHYPTDVLAGWIAGLIWALLCFVVAKKLQKAGQVEIPELLPDSTSTSTSARP